jgi:hypothetical protein
MVICRFEEKLKKRERLRTTTPKILTGYIVT